MNHDELESVAQLAEQLGVARVDLAQVQVSTELLRLVPGGLARRYELLPLNRDDGGQGGGRAGTRLFVAVADPLNTDGPDALAHLLGVEVVCRFAPREELRAAIANNYGREIESAGPLFENVTEGAPLDVSATSVEATSENEDEAGGAGGDGDAPIIRLVHRIIERAVEQRASDIHLEPLARRFRVRYRIDGVLIEAEAPPKRLQAAIISRVKLMAGISIAEKRLPQDGRIQLKLGGRSAGNRSSFGGAEEVGATALDLRVSSLPTSHGESIVMRILDGESLRIGLGELGFMADDRAAFERLIAQPDGIVLVTGPTGSGKTTTLYSCLHAINQPDRKIITVEDPVEYQLSSVNQVPVRPEVGMTFAAALRAMLRQAPNIVMLGEIRDAETAEIAIHASLTGHLVFSTLHTNDAPSAVTRLIDIGIKPFLVATSLRGVLAQRLVRKVCPDCGQAHTPSAEELRLLGIGEAEARGATFRRGAGCPKCHHTGYRGRIGIFELLLVNETMQQLLHDGASVATLRNYARPKGMRSLREDGCRKVLAGLTTIEEVLAETLADEACRLGH